MDFWTAIVPIGITLFISYSLFDAGVLHGNYKRFWGLVKQMRPIMLLTTFPIIVLTIAAGVVLNTVVGLKWGWTSFLHSDGSTSNINMIGFSYLWYVPVFATLIILAMPHLTMLEEVTFRHGSKGFKSIMIRSLIFGLVHMIAGISLGFALALTIPGLWFSYQYKKGGIERSAAYHLVWNYAIVLVLLITIASTL